MSASIPKLLSILPLLSNDSKCIEFLTLRGVFYGALPCPKCHQPMARDEKRGRFRCGARCCRTELSLRKHTFFYGSVLNCSQILLLGYLWLLRSTQQQAIAISGHSPNTVTSFLVTFDILLEPFFLKKTK